MGRRRLAGLVLCMLVGATLAGDESRRPANRPLPAPVAFPELARYLRALDDLPAPVWSLLAVTASVLAPGPDTVRALTARLPASGARDVVYSWSYEVEARRMDAVLASVQEVYAAILPPARAAFYDDALDAERGRLLATGRVDYRGLSQLVTLVNREQGLMARPELADLDLVRLHQLDPVAQPRDVPALLRERHERRDLAAVVRSAAERVLAGAASRVVATPAGPLTLLADLGRPAGPPRTFQFIRARLNDLADETIAAHDVYYTAGEFLALEPAAPPGRWADSLPPEQRAYAPTNALSPRLGRAAILAPEHASRVLWPSLQDSRVVVDDLSRL